MKKITRNEAVSMFGMLGSMALGHLSEDTLGLVMDNFNECRKVQEEIVKLNEELAKRLYADVDEKRKDEFFKELSRMNALRESLKASRSKEEAQKTLKDMESIAKMLNDSYSDVKALNEKHDRVLNQLLAKEIEIELHEVDVDEFIKGLVKGKKDAPIHEIRAAFAPMFKAEEQQETDFSELDDLLKD
jgi:flagellar hook-basal body complex protein FliE